MNGAICFICNETYYNDNETRIHVERIERDGTTIKTLKWDGMLCDKCLGRLLGKEGGDD